MLKTLDLKLPDKNIAEATRDLLCAFKFGENRKRNFAQVLGIARKADIFLESSDESSKFFLAGFSKKKEQATLAMAAIEEMRISGWEYILFAQGRVQIKKNALRNVLDCFGAAANLRDPTKHCHKFFSRPRKHFIADESDNFTLDLDRPLGAKGETENEGWLLPCHQLEGFVMMSEKDFETDPLSMIEVAAERRLVKSCPFFKLEAFARVPIAPKVAKAKKFW